MAVGPERISRVTWKPSYRLVPSKFPPIQLYERVAETADLEAIIAIENLTNERLRDEVGEIQLLAPEDRIAGPGTSPIMAAFTHVNPEGGRFTDGRFGAYYAARDLETAVHESVHHREIFLARTQESPGEMDMRCYLADLDADLVDIRGLQATRPELYNRDSYADSQPFARNLRAEGAMGIVWNSVRRPGGECVAAFKPRALQPTMQGPHLSFVWDGKRIASYYEKGRLASL